MRRRNSIARQFITTLSGPSLFTLGAVIGVMSYAAPSSAQLVPGNIGPTPDEKLNLAADSPFRDPNMIYLEADEVFSNDETGVITAQGNVEGRYQDRTIRADKVVYSLESGRVLGIGHVVLIDGSGVAQYASKIELTNGLETGVATNMTSRLPNGGVAGAAFATRTIENGYQLYNAFYTACQPCQEPGRERPPTWQIKARQVSQDQDKNIIKYRDAVFQVFGVPVLYTPYLAHPDPSAKRASGWLAPYVGISSSKGFNVRLPYFWAANDYTDFVFTPRIYQRVNPVMEVDIERMFYSGTFNLNGSFTYGRVFDRKGRDFRETDIFTPADEAPLGNRWRSHLFTDGHFDLTDRWSWGFTGQVASDDLYLNRYDLDEDPGKRGLYEADSRRLVSQIYALGQDDDFRLSVSAYGFQSLRTRITRPDDAVRSYIISREDDSILPIVAPSIDISKYWTDPLLQGRLELTGNFTSLTRKIGTDYQRGTVGLSWDKTYIAPGGIELKPFGNVRYDNFVLHSEEDNKVSFNRTLGQVGADIRWPFIRPGQKVDWIIEPRAQITQSFGKSKTANFITQNQNGNDYSLQQDSLDIDLDHELLWSPDKATGYDLWQKGFRADVGGSVATLWDDNRAALFLGQSFASNYEDSYTNVSGLSGDRSDFVGMFELDLGKTLSFNTRMRYDDETQTFRRLDAGVDFNTYRFGLGARYYRVGNSGNGLISTENAPNEEISGKARLRLTKNWSIQYAAQHDIDLSLTRRQEAGLVFEDDCTRIELLYNRRNFDSDVIRNSSGFNVRITLSTLGSTDSN